MNHQSPPIFPNEDEIIHVYCDIVAPSLICKQSGHMLSIFTTRGVFTKTAIMKMYKQVSPRMIDSISIRLTNQNGEGIPYKHYVNIFAVLHFRQGI